MTEPKIILLDIETAPNLGWVWAKWQQDVIENEKNWHLLSFSYKMLGEKSVKTYALPDFPGYKKDKGDDRKLIEKLWHVLDEADIVIAHNGDNFDIPKTFTRFLIHGLRKPAPFKTIDTLKIARKHFGFDSNRLNDLAKQLGLGHKLPHTGFALWKGCMTGDRKSWLLMKKYNAQDVLLLEKVYLKLRPWNTSRPNLNVYTEKNGCPVCSSTHVQKRGFDFSITGKKQRYQCKSCGAWSHGPINKVPNITIR